MVKANGKGKARIPKSKRKTENATPSATTVATASEPVKTDAEALDIVPSVEENKEENKGEEVKEEKGKETSKPVNKSRKRNRIRRKTKNVANTATVKDADKPENSDGDKASNKAESMGMVFMCNSKTKKDCYQYKVLGLPASKKDTVAEIYKGMRLFLFDVDLKLMYGIYKAAGRGGYNIEPKAFKSAFPSQVRFTVLDDCLPLPEEKFKKIIKDNYYGKNKFNCQLNSEQVKNLCKLFRATTKGAKSKRVGRPSRREARTIAERGRSRWPSQDDVRHSPLGRSALYLEPPSMYEREAYPPQALPPPLLLPPQQHPYAHERPLDMDYYRRETHPEHHSQQVFDLEPRRREITEYRDGYSVYRQPPPYNADSLYSVAPPPAYQLVAPPTQPPLYRY
ncbi:uncharacterized protein LOC122639229 isoform X2 [Telopea speciosissima]|uniref:uncharacterized protein LOC122639229 isoform X2 n=1 Tax=Telopea speciosissima TaxID=54955 RepID=UPI001CC62194|nr:uncharacterized protein LOC122639229 isoform X2 [Telopea speciosissima]